MNTSQSIQIKRTPNVMLVKPGERLVVTDVQLSELADTYSYSYNAAQPYINEAVGYVLWPSIALAPNATVSLGITPFEDHTATQTVPCWTLVVLHHILSCISITVQHIIR